MPVGWLVLLIVVAVVVGFVPMDGRMKGWIYGLLGLIGLLLVLQFFGLLNG